MPVKVAVQKRMYTVSAAMIGFVFGFVTIQKGTRGTIFLFYKNIENVGCEYERWVVATQLCKLCDTSDTIIGRACAMFRL